MLNFFLAEVMVSIFKKQDIDHAQFFAKLIYYIAFNKWAIIE